MADYIYFRADASAKSGLGHLMRCVSLANYLESTFKIEFIVSVETKDILDQLLFPFPFKILKNTKDLEREVAYLNSYCRPGSIVVLDGYQFDTNYMNAIRQGGRLLIYIDDKHEIEISADIVINHTGGISKKDFTVTDMLTRYCLGPDYAILRPEFFHRSSAKFEFDVLVSFGGADPDNFTLNTIRGLSKKLKVAILIGPAYSFLKELDEEVRQRPDFFLFKSLNASEVVDLMVKSRRLISSASGTAYEYLAVSKGQLYIKQTAENQSLLFTYLKNSGAALEYTGVFDDKFVSKQIIDGCSGKRILKVFSSLVIEHKAVIRRVKKEDIMTVFNWANDSEVRSQSYNPAPISLEDHEKWFSQRIRDDDTIFYMVFYCEKPVGQIRFDIEDNIAVINYLVSPDYRGEGWGERILRLGIRHLRMEIPDIVLLKGYVKKTNGASVTSFIRCNFVKEDTKEYPDSVEFVLSVS